MTRLIAPLTCIFAFFLASFVAPQAVSPSTLSAPVAVASEPRFQSYDGAIRYVRKNYRGESIAPSRSSWITSAEYYPASGRGYLILGMQGKPYIFASLPAFGEASRVRRHWASTITGI